MPLQEVRDENGKLVCQYDAESDTIYVKRGRVGNRAELSASLKDYRILKGNSTLSDK